MNPIVYAIPVFMLTIVIELIVAARRRLAPYDLADAITSLHFGVLSQVAGAFTKVFTFGIYVLVFEYARLFTLPADRLWVWIAALIGYDFLYYWVHRAGHEVSLVWASHQVHHSSEWYNLSTALRQTATGALFVWPLYLPLALLGVPPVVFGAVALIDLLYQYWVHTELVGRLGWADRVFVTPSNHRVHHGQNDYCLDRNYGGILILWDRLFGTFAEERSDEKVVYGIRKPLASFDPVFGNLNVYRDIAREAAAQPSLHAALGRWFAPPAGWNTPVPHLDTSTVTRYLPATSRQAKAYAAVQYALSIPVVMHFIAVAAALPLGARVGYALLIVASCVSLGWWLEGHRVAVRIESLRIAVVGAIGLVAPQTFGWAESDGLRAAIVIWIGASALGLLAVKRARAS
jgi:sterol desaturase/sphingolipid hydroxylase (fatty acid hydroxylase superfamily)